MGVITLKMKTYELEERFDREGYDAMSEVESWDETDISRPPCPPPNRQYQSGWFGLKGDETDESRCLRQMWNAKMEVYRAMRHMPNQENTI